VSRIVVGVMGPGEGATDEETNLAYELGGLIAQEGWVLLTGGRRAGVMDAASRGAKAAQGTVVGILPGTDVTGMSAAVDIPIITGMQEARNNINVLSSRVLFFIGMNAGTASELALALKAGRPAILIGQRDDVARVFRSMVPGCLEAVADVASAMQAARRMLAAAIE
jgi:uncharacterized protein (TIGR00725 family)